VLAPQLSTQIGQLFLVENRAGSAGDIGAEQVGRSAADRYAALRAIPCVGINPALFGSMSFGIAKSFAPATLAACAPGEVVRCLNEALSEVLRTQEIRNQFAAQGPEALATTPEQFGELVSWDLARCGDVIRRAGIKIAQHICIST